MGNGQQRAAVSVTANSAEWFGRFSYQENLQFCCQSRAAVYELRDHLITAMDENYLEEKQFARRSDKAATVIKLLNGYIRATTRRKVSSSLGDGGKS